MRQHFLILIFLVLVIAILAGLNAVSYTRIEQNPDSEYSPNRSTYNSGSTGSSAFYALLAETGNKVVRWQQPPSALLSSANSRIKTLVLIGASRKEVTDEEAEKILLWVSRGGRLVLMDRSPAPALLKPQGNWALASTAAAIPNTILAPGDTTGLIDKVAAAKPVQPTVLMKGITAVQPSRFASSITLGYSETHPPDVEVVPRLGTTLPTPQANRFLGQPAKNAANNETPPKVVQMKAGPVRIEGSDQAPVTGSDGTDYEEDETPVAPVIHLSNLEKDILADYPYGQGRVIFLSDPFIVSNAGIKLVDNAILAVNMVAVENGTVAFDEYHQGYGSENTFFRYFAGTPVPGLLAQGVLLISVLIWTRGRRFARPLPVPAKDRRSKLENIAAMADLQQSSRAYDLAVENVYLQTKRDMARLVGADNTVSRKQLAEAVAERAGLEPKELYKLMAKCEDIIAGEPTNAKETMSLISQLRALEEKLGLHRRARAGREIKK